MKLTLELIFNRFVTIEWHVTVVDLEDHGTDRGCVVSASDLAMSIGKEPAAGCMVLVMDQLNTHSTASLYEAFEPSEARRLAEKLEIHYTPKHGSWLNVAG